MLIDSDILIDYLRGYDKANHFFLENLGNIYISFISKFEILAGASNKLEMTSYENFLLNFAVLPLSNEILNSAFLIFKENYLTNKIGSTDSIIAATAINYNFDLYSRNKKHYKGIENLKFRVPY